MMPTMATVVMDMVTIVFAIAVDSGHDSRRHSRHEVVRIVVTVVATISSR